MAFSFRTEMVVDRTSPVSLYVQISKKLIALINQGKILPGSFLPGTREMASALNVRRKTVIHAYNEVVGQGWVKPILRKGYCVISDLPPVKLKSSKLRDNCEFANPQLADFLSNDATALHHQREDYTCKSIVVDDGLPDIRLSPFGEFFKQYRSIVRKDRLEYLRLENTDGDPLHLSRSTAAFLNRTRGLNITDENVLMSQGARMAIYISAALLIRPGDKVITNDPNYLAADQIFKQLGAELYRVPVDEDGMDVNGLETLLKKHKFKLLYITPHHHYPTTVTMSAGRRVELLNLAAKYDLWVIEDDYDYDFHYRSSPILPLSSAENHGKIIYIGSFTKLLGPSFRVGYMVAGRQFIEHAAAYKRLMGLTGDFMMQEALAELVDNGMITRHIKRSRAIYTERLAKTTDALREILGDKVSFTRPQGGLAIWLRFNEAYPLEKMINRARERELFLKGNAYYKHHNSDLNNLRFGFASLNNNEMHNALLILRDLF